MLKANKNLHRTFGSAAQLCARCRSLLHNCSAPPNAYEVGVRLLCFLLFIEGGAVWNPLPVVGSPASGSVPAYISGSFVPGAIVG